MFCDNVCRNKSMITLKKCQCKNCGKNVTKQPHELRVSKNVFCSQSCSATFNNKNKERGACRSKLEAWLEKELIKIFPNLEFHFNRKDAINSELDIYIPNLKLAFELNGIFHYEPIFGKDKLNKIKNNDHRKFAACHERGISLCVIDTSKQKRFTEKSSQEFLKIIKDILCEACET